MDEGRRLLDRGIPPEYRASWTARIGETESRPARSIVSFLPFRIATRWLALRSGICLKVLAARPVHPVPFRTNAVFLGLANVEGKMLPCASPVDALELERNDPFAPSAAARMIVAARQGARWCFPVDETAGIEARPAPEFQPGSGALESWIAVGERRVALVDDARLFAALERSLRQ
jgi:chemotaxis-related protein WspD